MFDETKRAKLKSPSDEAFRQGVEKDVEKIIAQYYHANRSKIKSSIKYYDSNHDDINRVITDSFMILINEIKKGVRIESPLSYWRTCAEREKYQLYKKTKKSLLYRSKDIDDPQVQIQDDSIYTLEAKETEEVTLSSLKKMDKDCHNVLHAFIILGMKVKEIAVMLDMKPNTVSQHKRRCFPKFRVLMNKAGIYAR